MRLVLSVLAALAIVLGAVWVLQGFNLFPGKSFMNGQHKWALYGACVAFGCFVRQNARAEALGLDLRHFIISSGNREIIEGSPIAHEFERIYASAFLFDADGDAIGAALAVNYTGKTQYLFRINKWTLEEWDEVAINKVLAKEARPVPFDRIAFFGDGMTDIPTMRLVTDQGGQAIAVYNPNNSKSKEAALKLRDDGRAGFAGPADYTEGSPLDQLAGALLAEIAASL